MDKMELIEKAKEARNLSYSPYSNFAVGAAILCKDGRIFLGANVENASYPLCMCAERNAVYNAYMNGYKKDDFEALALCTDTDEPSSPCGACRQVLSELFPAKAPIYMSAVNGKIVETTIKELLPYAFSEEDLKK
ncbi:MAG: cytidine deaminase [Bacilli bacterium]|nr:cytidine deaminase [Bacilli bacterium]